MFPQSAKIRTSLSTEPESQRCRPTAPSDYCDQGLWEQQEMRLIKRSRLAQSHTPLPTTARASFWFQLSTLEKLHSQIKERKKKKKRRNSSIEQRLCQTASHWTRMKKEENVGLEETGNKGSFQNQQTYVQICQQSQGVEDAGRELCQVIAIKVSESSKKWDWSNAQGWLNLMLHCPPPLERAFDFSSPHLKIAQPN